MNLVFFIWRLLIYTLYLCTSTSLQIKLRELEPIWTWTCTNLSCERRNLLNETNPISLTTCNMLCGSTQLWPQPTGPIKLGNRGVTFFHHQIKLETSLQGPARVLLDQAYVLFNENIAKMVATPNNSKQTSEIADFLIKVIVNRANETKLKLSTDESYSLTLKPRKKDIVAFIHATTFFGARHGLETLSQLIWWDEFASGGMLKVLIGATVQDSPVFPYRGIMLDTSRNFIPLGKIKHVLIGMAANKLNVFHWHITDSQSFPFMSPRVPQLAEYGAYGPDMIYSEDDVKEIVKFALVRGIRVVMEVDVPAHAGNGWTWGPEAGLGDLAVCVNEQPWSSYCAAPPCGQLNPQNPNMYDILEKLYKDILELSNETEIFHLGGDEVNLQCWASHLDMNINLYDLWGEFTIKALQRLANANGGKPPSHVVVWSSDLSKKPYTTKYLNKSNIVIQFWLGSWKEIVNMIFEGYRVIISHADAWYLDSGFGSWNGRRGANSNYSPWQSVYKYKPWQQYGVDKNMILGGEACIWGEQVDVNALDVLLWPRAAAFAERVWSDPQTDFDFESVEEDAYTRLGTQRDRLLHRGLAAEAMWPLWCTQNPGECF